MKRKLEILTKILEIRVGYGTFSCTWSEKFKIDVRYNAVFELFVRFDEIVFCPHCILF